MNNDDEIYFTHRVLNHVCEQHVHFANNFYQDVVLRHCHLFISVAFICCIIEDIRHVVIRLLVIHTSTPVNDNKCWSTSKESTFHHSRI